MRELVFSNITVAQEAEQWLVDKAVEMGILLPTNSPEATTKRWAIPYEREDGRAAFISNFAAFLSQVDSEFQTRFPHTVEEV